MTWHCHRLWPCLTHIYNMEAFGSCFFLKRMIVLCGRGLCSRGEGFPCSVERGPLCSPLASPLPRQWGSKWPWGGGPTSASRAVTQWLKIQGSAASCPTVPNATGTDLELTVYGKIISPFVFSINSNSFILRDFRLNHMELPIFNFLFFHLKHIWFGLPWRRSG